MNASTNAAPQLASAGILVRGDGQMLLTRHALGPFAGRWSMPLAGVADNETAEDALTRLMREMLGVEPGPFEFLDTIYLEGDEGARFVLNAFTCIDWRGEPSLRGGLYDQAVWAPPAEAGALDLLPEVRDWIAASSAASGAPAAQTYDGATLLAALADARGALIAAFDVIPSASRRERRDEGWSPLDVLAHAAEVEAYYIAETRRLVAEPGRTWRAFNDAQWDDLHRLRPAENEATVRARLQAVRAATRTWLAGVDASTLSAYGNHAERGVVQIGDRVGKVVAHDREHTDQLRQMAGQPPREF